MKYFRRDMVSRRKPLSPDAEAPGGSPATIPDEFSGC